MTSLVTDAAKAVFVAEANDHLAGYAVVAFEATWRPDRPPSAELATLYVQGPFFRRGVGTALLQRAEAAARGHGDAPLWLSVNAQNAPARAFYCARGYRTIDTMFFEIGGAQYSNEGLEGGAREAAGR